MTPSRLLKILFLVAGALAFVLLAIVLIQRPSRSSTPFAKTFDAAQKISIQTGSSHVDLLRDSATWTVSLSSALTPYKADPEKTQRLETTLRGIQVEDVISERPERAAEFAVNPESATVITLWDKNNNRLAAGVFGKQAADFAHIYFRYPDAPTVYLARGAVRGDLNAPEPLWWRDRTLLNIVEDNVLTLVIQGPGYTTSLVRSSDTWSCNGRLVDAAPVWGMLGMLAHLRAEEFAEPSQVAAGSLKYATLTLQMRDKTVHVLHMGRLDPQTTRYPVMIDSDPSVARVAEGSIKTLLQKPSDFKPKKS